MVAETRTRDADRSRAEILDAAERLFAERGYDAVTMAQIGAAAGVSRGTPGYFFGSKEDLYREVVRRAGATFRMLGETLRVRDAAGERDAATLVGETVRVFADLVRARPGVVRLLDRDGGATAGTPQADALRDALAPLGDGAGPAAMAVLALVWHPVAQPASAAALGIDAQGDGADAWVRAVTTAALTAGGVTGPDAAGSATPSAANTRDADRPAPKRKKDKKDKDKKGKKGK